MSNLLKLRCATLYTCLHLPFFGQFSQCAKIFLYFIISSYCHHANLPSANLVASLLVLISFGQPVKQSQFQRKSLEESRRGSFSVMARAVHLLFTSAKRLAQSHCVSFRAVWGFESRGSHLYSHTHTTTIALSSADNLFHVFCPTISLAIILVLMCLRPF